MPTRLLEMIPGFDGEREGVEAAVADGRPCRGRVEAEVGLAVVGNGGLKDQVLAGAHTIGVVRIVAVEDGHEVRPVVLGAVDFEHARPQVPQMSMPRCLATLKMSLSPRPQRFMTM